MREKRMAVLENGIAIEFLSLKKGMKFQLYEATGEVAHANLSVGRDENGYLTAASDAYVNENGIGEIMIEVED